MGFFNGAMVMVGWSELEHWLEEVRFSGVDLLSVDPVGVADCGFDRKTKA